MRIRPVISTLFGIAIASGSVYLAKDHIQFKTNTAGVSSDADLVEIYVARSEIAFGQTIESHHVTLHPWPREALPAGVFTDIDVLVPDNRRQLRRAKGRFYPGEVMLLSKVSNFGEKVTLVQKLGENTRAMAIEVDAVTAVGGFVTPGDHVDIVLTQGAKQELRAVTILQNIRVIGVDQQSEELSDQPEIARTITVEVTPQQGQRLALAQKAGTLSLTLRTLDSVEDEPMEMVRLRDLLQEEGPVEKVEAQPTVKLRRGTETEVVTIQRQRDETEENIEADPATELEPNTQKDVRLTPASATPRVKPRTRPVKISQAPSQ
ncbi:MULTISPECIES: Flp pilus assembly protein CpaB [unclassified Ruegeria]|uniref:Flp pilus assembly protein CpaB n=1 Tax=unclassified Ruegeria TaxID=2625375 RepID=UPI001492BABF|nr:MULTISPECIES: Flp pilus assembly protein CpaB [unclassified Ruegeria]NOD88218.1 Flp pilus assembly protein CpaB [Ruegeria sp. HKCCD4318]NOE13127.1 Flp pilus assembly protein CpaB [Ruegeria sp. HKCCD4318-2]NOG11331.1 Flp pilus assembly protein CpaB [Ruegeria sp. HKCCD4315]